MALLDNRLCLMGLRRNTVLVAMGSWDDYAYSGMRWVAQPCSATSVRYNVGRWCKRQFDLLTWRHWSSTRVVQRDDVDRWVWPCCSTEILGMEHHYSSS
ncbi:hypothetical protein HU200_055061 [Digitaria exilis]|uniref:Uncharacterized protein n=1 Tax=Digitaria exilis TaxID=1010633 RepID=A0A835E3F3_9POAL|nr:hypothetical protein HU200_055061 [Digitaria exilis]